MFFDIRCVVRCDLRHAEKTHFRKNTAALSAENIRRRDVIEDLLGIPDGSEITFSDVLDLTEFPIQLLDRKSVV